MTFFLALLIVDICSKADTAALFLFLVCLDITVGCKAFFSKGAVANFFRSPIVCMELCRGVLSKLVDYVDFGLALRIESLFNSFFWNMEKFYEASLFYFSGFGMALSKVVGSSFFIS